MLAAASVGGSRTVQPIAVNGGRLTTGTVSAYCLDSYGQEDIAQLFGGKVRQGTTKKVPRLWVARHDGTPFRIEDVADRLSAWTGIIEEFQSAVRVRAQDRET